MQRVQGWVALVVDELEVCVDAERLGVAPITQMPDGAPRERVYLQPARGRERHGLAQAGLARSVLSDDDCPLADGLTVGIGEIQLQIPEELQAADTDAAQIRRPSERYSNTPPPGNLVLRGRRLNLRDGRLTLRRGGRIAGPEAWIASEEVRGLGASGYASGDAPPRGACLPLRPRRAPHGSLGLAAS